jgi:formylglycine-generating enzyme required for sulfatase activity
MWFAGLGAAAAQPQVPGTAFRDCDDCPEMIVVPAGSFTIGAPGNEVDRTEAEGPPRQLRFDHPFAVGRFEITRGQFARFRRETPPSTMPGTCVAYEPAIANFRERAALQPWMRPGFAQQDDHPAVCVSWDEAKAYANWLSKRTGQAYRLLSEAQWEYVARAGSTTSRPWGDDPDQSCRYANLADETFVREVPRNGKRWYPGWHKCRDGYAYTAPVGRFAANAFKVHDMLGNAWEWVEDCWNPGFSAMSPNGAPATTGNCTQRVYRGGAWRSYPSLARSARRSKMDRDHRHALVGFRVAREIAPAR